MRSARPLASRQHSASLKRSTAPWSTSRWLPAYKHEAARLRELHANTITSYHHNPDSSRGYFELLRSCTLQQVYAQEVHQVATNTCCT